jgi:dihydroorotate dehydrogenase (fumarate)
MASALLQRGPQALSEVLNGMHAWMESHEYNSVEQLKGAMSHQNMPDPDGFSRTAYLNALNSFSPPRGVRY